MTTIKNICTQAGLFMLVCTFASVPAAQALNKSQSAEYLRTMSRNATTQIDATFYNPAGLAFIDKEGFHFAAGNYALFQQKTIQDESELLVGLGFDEPYESVGSSFLYPTLHAAYRMGDWAAHFNFLPTGGGGGGNYENGLPSFDTMILGAASDLAGLTPSSYARDMYFKGTSYNLGTTLGLAYKVHEMISISAGYRFTYGIRTYDGHVKSLAVGIGESTLTGAELPDMLSDATISIQATGISHSVILGVHIRPNDDLNIGIHGEYSGALNLENQTTFTGNPNLEALFSGSGFADGSISDERESPTLMVGADYQLTSELLLTSSAFVTLNTLSATPNADKTSDTIFISAGLEYQINDWIIIGLGCAHGTPPQKSEARDDLVFGLPHNYISTGVSFQVTEQWAVNTGALLDFGLAMTDNTSAAPGGGKQNRTENLQLFGLGVTYTP